MTAIKGFIKLEGDTSIGWATFKLDTKDLSKPPADIAEQFLTPAFAAALRELDKAK